MKAVMKTAPGEAGVIVTDIPTPAPAPGQALIRVTATGLCGTDVHIAHDEYAYEAPVVMGHEIAGVVEGTGSAEDAHWVGKAVAVETYMSTCETCASCRSGRRNLCPDRRSVGSFENGGFAEHLVIPVINLHELPQHLTGREGALMEPLACVTHLLLDPPLINAGDRVLVTGPGAMGQLAAGVAQACGGDVVLSGLAADAGRLEIAGSRGIETTTTPVPEASCDVVIECSGSVGGAGTALRSVKRAGRYVQVGIFGRSPEVPLDQVLYKEVTITSGFASTPQSWLRAMALVRQQRIDLTSLVTDIVPLTGFQSALAAVQAGQGVKTVVIPDSLTPA